MNYREDIEKCIKFIELNVKEPISAKDIACQSGYSLYHFSRIFHQYTGVSVNEYIRQRRLSLAATELFEGRKIIDIALDYQFKTPSGFSKAFRRMYGYSPTQYIKRVIPQLNNQKLNLKTENVKPKIRHYPDLKVAGYGIKTNVIESTYTKDISSYWKYYDGENLENQMYKLLNPTIHAELGLCLPISEDGKVTYLLGVIVDNFSKVNNEMFTVKVPAAEYAVFTTPPVDTSIDCTQKEFAEMITLTWKFIFEEWFKDSEYIYDESKMDFEYYDERCHFRKDTVMDIFVPVKKKDKELN